MRAVAEVREFNRFYTGVIGVLTDGLLHTPYTPTPFLPRHASATAGFDASSFRHTPLLPSPPAYSRSPAFWGAMIDIA